MYANSTRLPNPSSFATVDLHNEVFCHNKCIPHRVRKRRSPQHAYQLQIMVSWSENNFTIQIYKDTMSQHDSILATNYRWTKLGFYLTEEDNQRALSRGFCLHISHRSVSHMLITSTWLMLTVNRQPIVTVIIMVCVDLSYGKKIENDRTRLYFWLDGVLLKFEWIAFSRDSLREFSHFEIFTGLKYFHTSMNLLLCYLYICYHVPGLFFYPRQPFFSSFLFYSQTFRLIGCFFSSLCMRVWKV